MKKFAYYVTCSILKDYELFKNSNGEFKVENLSLGTSVEIFENEYIGDSLEMSLNHCSYLFNVYKKHLETGNIIYFELFRAPRSEELATRRTLIKSFAYFNNNGEFYYYA